VALYRQRCRNLEKRVKADSHDTCNSPMAPLKKAPRGH
jgi:hypothetical protein